MKKNNFSGKTLEEAKISALENLKCNEKDIYINETETKCGLFKAKKVEIEVDDECGKEYETTKSVPFMSLFHKGSLKTIQYETI